MRCNGEDLGVKLTQSSKLGKAHRLSEMLQAIYQHMLAFNGRFHTGDQEYPCRGSIICERLRPLQSVMAGDGQCVKTLPGYFINELISRVVNLISWIKIRVRVHFNFESK